MPLASAQDAADLLAQARDGLGERVQLVDVEPGRWYALFNDGGFYRLEWSDDWARLVLSAELGMPPAGRERACLNLALSYNALWREVGNLRMARDGEQGALLLIGELGPGEAEPEAFNAALLHFEGLRRWWSHALMRAGDEWPEPPLPPARLFERV